MKKFYREVIVKNQAQCLACNDIVESKSGHDFRTCSCGNLSVDGGKNYLRRAFKENDTWIELSETFQEERQPYEWENSKEE